VKRRLFGKKRRGQAMVEMALSLPLLLAVLAGIIEMSMLLSHASRLQEAVNQATRALAENETEDLFTAKQRVQAHLAGDKLLTGEEIDIDVEESVDINGASTITVSAHMRLRPFAFEHFGTFKCTASATYRKEWGHQRLR